MHNQQHRASSLLLLLRVAAIPTVASELPAGMLAASITANGTAAVAAEAEDLKRIFPREGAVNRCALGAAPGEW
jgi:hypothetical protein